MTEYIELVEEQIDDGTRTKANVDQTPIRNIDVPAEGDEYHASYYELLEQADKSTIHFAASLSELPTPDMYDSLVGVVPSEAEHIDGETVHIYDSDSGQWVDTFNPVSDFITKAEAEIDAFWDHVQLEEYDDAAALEDQVLENKRDISALDGRLDDEVDDLQSVIRNAVGDKYVDESTTAEADLDALEETVDELYDAIS